jgi:hypothetical protein
MSKDKKEAVIVPKPRITVVSNIVQIRSTKDVLIEKSEQQKKDK